MLNPPRNVSNGIGVNVEELIPNCGILARDIEAPTVTSGNVKPNGATPGNEDELANGHI